jgi:L-asparaginase II
VIHPDVLRTTMTDHLLAAYRPIYQRTRGSYLESVHFGAVAVVDPAGVLIAWHGDPQTTTFMRSSAKPFQALPLIENGGLEAFEITDRELALICASHSGAPVHLEVLGELQARLGISEENLACGTHLPFHSSSRKKLICREEEPSPNHHNCSGKHTGMIALAKLLGVPMEGYTESDHPVQRVIRQTTAEMCSLPEDNLLLGRDGCSVVTFGMPLQNAALGWARLTAFTNLSPRREKACRKIVQAFQKHPEMAAGPERFDTNLIQQAGEKLIAKAGAEAFQSIGVFPQTSSKHPQGLGIAIKISDGDRGKTVRSAAALETLKQLEILTEDQLNELSRFGPVLPLRNQRDLLVGEARPCFQLEYGENHG